MIKEIIEKMKECSFEPFKELKVWTIISPFGGGKEELLKEIVSFHKDNYSVYQVRSEAIKSVSYMYDDKRLKYMKQLERAPLLVIVLDNNEDRTRNIIIPLVKYRLMKELLTVVLTELERDTYTEQYRDIARIGLVTQISETNSLETKKDKVMKEYFS